MKITKAIITVAGKKQRTLPLQTLIDRDGTEKSVLKILIEEVLQAGIDEICLVVRPTDETPYLEVAGEHAGRLHFVHQPEPLGYGHALYCTKEFIGQDPFLHLVGDHMFVSRTEQSCAQELVEIAQNQACAVSAVRATRENQLPDYGTVGGRRLAGQQRLYQIETVIEKPTPTEAEQRLIVPGLRAGHYLCFFGMHALTPAVIDMLGHMLETTPDPRTITLSDALLQLAQREKYLALEKTDWRYDLGAKYGLLTAQMALALNGNDRDEVLAQLLELLALRHLETTGR